MRILLLCPSAESSRIDVTQLRCWGCGVPRGNGPVCCPDPEGHFQARALLEQAAALGNVNAMIHLGNLHMDWEGTQRDEATAEKLSPPSIPVPQYLRYTPTLNSAMFVPCKSESVVDLNDSGRNRSVDDP